MVKGYKIEISRFKDFNAKVYEYSLDLKEAKERETHLLEMFKQVNDKEPWYSRVLEIELFKCINDWCNELTEEQNNECLNCEELRLDKFS